MNLRSIASAVLAEDAAVRPASAEPSAGNIDLAAHDRRFHPHGYDPKRDTCSLRADLDKGDNPDAAVGSAPSPQGEGWNPGERAEAERAADALRRILGGVTVTFSNSPYSGFSSTRKSIAHDETKDDEYLESVDANDLDLAREMIEEKAKEWGCLTDEGGSPLLLYHGAESGDITYARDDISCFATTSRFTAKVFARGRCDNAVLPIYGKMEKPLRLDAKRSNWDEILVPQDLEQFIDFEGYEATKAEDGKVYATTAELARAARTAGYDGIILKNVLEGSLEVVDDYIFLRGNFKSADTVTYDYYGNVIPLSKRFSYSDNIRYFRTNSGKVVGEYDRSSGKITLYPGAKVADVVHEFSHGLWQFAEEEAAAGRRSLLDKMHEIAVSAPKSVKDAVAADYPEASDSVYLEECFTHEMARRSDTAFAKAVATDEGKPWYRKAWGAIKSIWNGYASKHGADRADIDKAAPLPPAEAADFILGEMARGKKFGTVSHSGKDGGKRKSIIGEKGAAALGIGKLDEAQKMSKDGESRDDIWRKTGWWRGKDGKWRVEIPDIEMPFDRLPSEKAMWENHRWLMDTMDRLNVSTLGSLESVSPSDYKTWKEKKKKLDEMYDKESNGLYHVRDFVGGSGLEKAYPQLMDIPVTFVQQTKNAPLGGNYLDAYVGGDYNGKVIRVGRDEEDKKSVIAHELQHAIQKAEGFARGGDPVAVARTQKKLSEMNEWLKGWMKDYGFDKWQENASDSEISNAMRKFGGKPFPQYLAFIDTLQGDKKNNAGAVYKKAVSDIKEAQKIVPASRYNDSPLDIYSSFSGEVEARNTQKRLAMTPEERAATPPWETEDVPEDRQIVRDSAPTFDTRAFARYLADN